jgi:hypothetical protein
VVPEGAAKCRKCKADRQACYWGGEARVVPAKTTAGKHGESAKSSAPATTRAKAATKAATTAAKGKARALDTESESSGEYRLHSTAGVWLMDHSGATIRRSAPS